MIYFANPCGPAVVEAMAAGQLGLIETPLQGSRERRREAHAAGVQWCADNGCFSDRWDENAWWAWLQEQTPHADRCTFAVAPDAVADAWLTLVRSRPWLRRIQELGFPVAYVAQDGIDKHPIPWHDFDTLFIGGTTEFKLGPVAAVLAGEAKARGKWVHMGRVNSYKRYDYARTIGCDSVDGTFLTFGPDRRLPELLSWVESDPHPSLF